ncbi:DUF1850 domain-containing protein [Sporosarcina sp. JAI121]|uniref:DUF1850 domain-containing protein n=1 Tax=Sporosarcina sp. JAI121 TaxID=2723064 RepID=UPI0015CA78F8|nr:DUF1850 domain-containing protein [Sporosarcina sp. JAI121]NYF23798.1 hypothetical protein [Sporosarcina sp. JAI121]
MKKLVVSILLVLIATGILFIPVQSGFLLTDVDGKPFYFISDKTKRIIIGWRHSVELTPWEETYQVLDNGLFSLESTTYKSYGAGTPDTEGTAEMRSDGFIHVTGIKRVIPYYSLLYSPISHYTIELSGKKYPLSIFVPDYQIVQFHYETLPIYKWISIKFIHN